jgi:hypothetical protein
MELIHRFANATFPIEKKTFRLKWASKQKTFRIVKEQHAAIFAARDHPNSRPKRAVSSGHRAYLTCRFG